MAATARAAGNPGIAAWRDIRRLMIHRPQHYIQVTTLRGPSRRREPPPYMPVLRHFSEGGNGTLAPRFLR